MTFSIGSGAYLTRYSFLEGVAKMARHGYRGVDHNAFVDTTTELFNLEEDAYRLELERQADILQSFHISTVQTHGPWRYPPQDITKEDREERFSVMTKSIRGTAYLNSPFMIIHPLMPYGENSPQHPEIVYDINLEFMYRLAEYGREWGVTVCYENMPFPDFPISRPDDIASFARTLNHPNFKVCLDTGHSLVCGIQPSDAVRMIGGDLLATLHIHDNDGTADKHQLVGDGIMDFGAFVRALDEVSFRGAINLETQVDRFNLLTPEERDLAEIQMLAHIRSFFE